MSGSADRRLGPLATAALVGLVASAAARAIAGRWRRGPARPSWSARTEVAAAAMRAVLMGSKTRGTAWLRAAQATVPVRSPFAGRVRSERVELGGVGALVVRPADGEPPPRTVVYLHGGGYVIGTPEFYLDVLARIAVGARARVVAVDYRRAPEHRFPAAHDDCLAAVRAVLATGADPRSVGLAGDSAGGALCVATLCSLRDAGEALPGAAALLCPWTDPLAEGGSMVANESADFGDRELLVGWARDYAPGDEVHDPRIRVVHAKLAGLPPLLVQVGTAEVLLDQVQRFAERARAAGVDVRLSLYTDLFHDWQTLASLLPEGARAVDEIAAFLTGRLEARA